MHGVAASCSTPQPPPPAASLLAPGFRFHPTDEELVGYYLKRKVSGRPLRIDVIAEVDLCKCEPWELPGRSRLQSRDLEWYFFCPVDRKYPNRSRTNRATARGYWKTTCKDRPVHRRGRVVGMKKTLVFHAGRAPHGARTNWVMHEYRLEDDELTHSGIPQDAFVVCRIFQKSGAGPRNGAQYGAPFIEEEWEEEDEKAADGLSVAPFGGDAEINEALNSEFMEINDLLQSKHMGHQNGRAALCLEDTDGQGSDSHPLDPIHILDVFPEEIHNDQNLTDKVVNCIYEPNLRSSRTLTGGSGEQIILNDIAYSSPVQLEEFVELNDLEDDSMNISYPFGEGFVSCPLLACHASYVNRVHYGLDDDEFFDAVIQSAEPVVDNFNLETTDPLNTLSSDYASYQDAQDMVFHDASSEFLTNGQDIVNRVHDGRNLHYGLEDDEFFDAAFQSAEPVVDNFNLQATDPLNTLSGDYASHQDAQDMVFHDASSEFLANGQDNSVYQNELLYSSIAGPQSSNFDAEVMANFDALDDGLENDSFSSLEILEHEDSSALSQLISEVDGGDGTTNMAIPELLYTNVGGNLLPALPLTHNQFVNDYENIPVAPDIKQNVNGKRTITSHLVNMLGSISAPPAFAAEYPASLGSTHVTVGMVDVHGLSATSSTGHCSLQKNGNGDLLLSYSIAENLGRKKSSGFQPFRKIQDWTISFLLRGGCYPFFLSALVLNISYKVGMCIYDK
ncbi:unnamed protein product [Musa hybrid cultivar]